MGLPEFVVRDGVFCNIDINGVACPGPPGRRLRAGHYNA